MEINEAPSTVGTGKYDPRGFYETPFGLVRAALEIASSDALLTKISSVRPLLILDCGSGTGRWGEVARELWPNSLIVGVDLFFATKHAAYDEWFHADFLDFPLRGGQFDLVVSNPPFKLAEEFIFKQWGLVNYTGMILDVLPLSFTCGQHRAECLWPQIEPYHEYALARRPNYGGKSGAAFESAIFEFRKGHTFSGAWPIAPMMWDYDPEKDWQADGKRKRKTSFPL
jgi:SAM-dependent methyltransferase